MNRYTAVLAGAVLAMSAIGAQGQSLSDALVNAYKNSYLLQSARASLRSTDEGVAQAVAGGRATLAAKTSVSATTFLSSLITTQAASLTLSANLTLWDGGDTALAIKAAKQNVAAARMTLVDTEQSVLLAAATAFLDMRRDAEFLKLAENSRAVFGRQVKASKDRFEVGEVRRTDVSQSEASFAVAQSTVALRQGTLEISREAYFVATGRYPGVLLSPPPLPPIPRTLAAAKSIAMRTHPSIARAKALARVAELNIYRAEAAMKPKFNLLGQLGINANAFSGDTAAIAIQGSLPIDSGGALTSAHRHAVALSQKARADIQRAGQLVTQNVNRFWAQLRIARATITARQKEIRASRVALRGVREESDLGARTTLDVLDAERALLRAQTNLAASKRDEYVAVYSLLSSMGLLTVHHLKLGIKTYDVAKNYNRVSTAPGPSNRSKLLDKILVRAGKK